MCSPHACLNVGPDSLAPSVFASFESFSGIMSSAQMDESTRAMIFALRNPPKGSKPAKLKDIRKLVKKKNGRRPTLQSISDAAKTFKTPKMKRGRPLGSRATTKAEDRNILNAFKKVRPPGYGVVARQVHSALPKKVQKKIQKRTVIRRLAEKGCKGIWS